jgi:hypothetical protein
MNNEILHIMKAPTHEWKYKGFFQTFSVADLEQALAILEEEDKQPTLNRRKAIRAEIDRRYEVAGRVGIPVEDVIKAESYRDSTKVTFDHAPDKASKFAVDWNTTCLEIYRKIQFRPPIPLVKR